MKSFFLLALSSIVLADTTITSHRTVTDMATVTTDIAAQETCLAACAPTDVNCQAICVGVPHPGAAQMNGVTDCVAGCDQGDGSAAATEAYTTCRNNCIASFIITTGTASPVASSTGKPSNFSATATGPNVVASSSGSATASTSGSASSLASQGLAAPTGARVGAVGGTLGLVFAAFALL